MEQINTTNSITQTQNYSLGLIQTIKFVAVILLIFHTLQTAARLNSEVESNNDDSWRIFLHCFMAICSVSGFYGAERRDIMALQLFSIGLFLMGLINFSLWLMSYLDAVRNRCDVDESICESALITFIILFRGMIYCYFSFLTRNLWINFRTEVVSRNIGTVSSIRVVQSNEERMYPTIDPVYYRTNPPTPSAPPAPVVMATYVYPTQSSTEN
eukprot:c7484_g1_i1.p1 GENE.c7484_g1_i1~~c7484_g1_i1.p1  ORF type:complete len:213 (-),score=28.72 c7484_g1_i1:391-1029(-)